MRANSKTLWVAALLLAPAAFAQDVVTVEATGDAAILGGDEVKALADATRNAQRTAVEQVAGVAVEGHSQTLNNVLVRDVVITRTAGYVKKTELISKKAEKGVLTVKLKVEVGKSDLAKDVLAARELVKRFGRPSIVIVLQEQTVQVDQTGKIGGAINTGAASVVLTDAFKADGWEIKDPAGAAGKLQLGSGLQMSDGVVKEIADLTQSNYVLYGTVVLRNQNPGQGYGNFSPKGEQLLFPVTGEYDLSLFATDTGTQVTKVAGKLDRMGKDGSVKSMAPATVSYERTALEIIKRRTDEITGPVRLAAIENFRNREVNGAEVKLIAKGLGNYAGAQDFKKAIEAMQNVKLVEQNDFRNGTGNYRVTYVGSTSELAEAVGKATFKKKKLEVSTVTGNSIEVSVGK